MNQVKHILQSFSQSGLMPFWFL